MEYLLRRIDPELHQALKIKAAQKKTTIREIIIKAIQKAVKS